MSNQVRYIGLNAIYDNNGDVNRGDNIKHGTLAVTSYNKKRSIIRKTNIVEIETFLNCVKKELFSKKLVKVYPKIPRQVQNAIGTLFKKEIVITQEDKGPKFVILDVDDYIDPMMTAIGKESLIQIDSDGILLYEGQLLQWILMHSEVIGNQWIKKLKLKELTIHQYGPAELYGIIKTHKVNYHRKPLRVITSGTRYILNGLDDFIFKHIKPLLKFINYMVIDTKTHIVITWII